MSKVLYTNPKGLARSRSSYSARKDFKFCKRKFYLTRVRGWRDRQFGVALIFGNVVEAAIQYHVMNHGHGGPDRFRALWIAAKAEPDFFKYTYRPVEESWENLLRIGLELLTIFAARLPSLPIFDGHGMPRFQVPLRKAVFPNSPGYENIENDAYLDLLTHVAATHPGLVKATCATDVRHVLIDIKTASRFLREELIRLDPQLIEYAWMYHDAFDIGFLWFVKQGHGYKAGSRITLLADAGAWKAGDELVVLKKGNEQSLVGPADTYAYGKDVEAGQEVAYAMAGAVRIPNTVISKQRLQFATARLTEQEIIDEGKLIGQTTIEMIMAHEQDFYPMEGGIRFPDEKCNFCSMRYICTDDSRGRDANLVRAGEEWLDTGCEE